jgi:hypothetical protein
LSGNTLFVTDYGSSYAGECNATTGAVINGSFIPGAERPHRTRRRVRPRTFGMVDDCSGRRGVARNYAPESPHRIGSGNSDARNTESWTFRMVLEAAADAGAYGKSARLS